MDSQCNVTSVLATPTISYSLLSAAPDRKWSHKESGSLGNSSHMRDHSVAVQPVASSGGEF